MRRYLLLIGALALFLAACSRATDDPGSGRDSASGESVPLDEVVDLICGPEADCLAAICTDPDHCPLTMALAHKAVYDFVKAYAPCEGCALAAFAPAKGVGKCIEYEVNEASPTWTVTFWVSSQCAFRYAEPTRARIAVELDSTTLAISRLMPPVAYITDAAYCAVDGDCRGLAGSGVPLIGCSNYLYAPLNWAGVSSGDACECTANQCRLR